MPSLPLPTPPHQRTQANATKSSPARAARVSRWVTATGLVAAVALGFTPAAAGAPHQSATTAQTTSAPLQPTAQPPAADVLDVDLASGSFEDTAQNRQTQVFGADPPIAPDRALGRGVATVDGTNAVQYEFANGYEADELTVECTIRLDKGGQDLDDRDTFCGAKEAGGFSLNAGETARMMVNIEGSYATAGAPIVEGVWYHAVGVWDGETVALYLNGQMVSEAPTEGEMQMPPQSARYFLIGADGDPAGEPEFNASGQVAQAAVYGQALSAEQVATRHSALFADRSPERADFAPEVPAPGTELRSPTTFTGTVINEELLARDLTFHLDGQEIDLGDEIGPGLSRGEHTIAYRGMDRLGEAIEGEYQFTSTSIPTGDGTTQSVTQDPDSGDSSAHLTARASHPAGGALRTSFLQGEAAPAQNAESGLIPATAFDRQSVEGDVELLESSTVDDPLYPADDQQHESAVSTEIPALRADVPLSEVGQQIVWRGAIDPAREVHLLLFDTESGRYEVADAARGATGRQVQLSAPVTLAHDVDGVVRTLVLGVDPFADDLEEPVQDGFADPADVDFSVMHITDTQYLISGSINPDKPPLEQQVWTAGYQDSYRWLAEHGAEHNVAFVGHTGDLIDSWQARHTDRDRAIAEFELASESQEILDETGIPNAVLPGNHDNQDGQDTGPDSLYNEYFGPERYEELAQSEGWQQRDAEYFPWKPGDNDNNYVLFSAGGEDFVVVSLGYQVSEEAADWASEVFAQHSGRNGIVMTHAAHKTSTASDGRDGVRTADGELISERVMESNPNVMLMLAGHVTGVTINVRQDVGSNGNNVVELTHDYQGYRIGTDRLGLTDIGEYDGDTPVTFGSTFFRLLQFDLDGGELIVDTYSAHLDEFGATQYDPNDRYDGREDDFRIPIQVHGRTTSFTTDSLMGATPTEQIIGSVTHDSGEDATVTWDGLDAGEPYTWFSVTRDAAQNDDAATLRTLALEGSDDSAQQTPLGEGIIQFGLFTGMGEEQDSEPAPDEPELPEREDEDEGPDLGAGEGQDPGAGPDPGAGEGQDPGAGASEDHGAAHHVPGSLPDTGGEWLPLVVGSLVLVLAGMALSQRRGARG